jgi:hypothetical protein
VSDVVADERNEPLIGCVGITLVRCEVGYRIGRWRERRATVAFLTDL